MIIASSQGGVNIEEVAAENPDAILYEPIDIVTGLTREQAVKIAEKVGLGNVSDQIAQTLLNMYELFVKKDALLIEINPYAEDAFDNSKCKGKFIAVTVTTLYACRRFKHQLITNFTCPHSLYAACNVRFLWTNLDFGLDAKFRFDDNAEYRQKELFKYRDFSQEDPKEVAATKFDLNYIALDGAIGMCAVMR